MCEQMNANPMTVLIDRLLYDALEAQEQIAARQQAEIERLRSIARLARIVVTGGDMTDGEWDSAYKSLHDAVCALPNV